MAEQLNAWGQDAKTAKGVRKQLSEAKRSKRIERAVKNARLDNSALRQMPGQNFSKKTALEKSKK